MRQPLFGEALEHRIVVGRFFRDILDDIPVFYDFAVFDAENVDSSLTTVFFIEFDVIVDEDQVAIGADVLDDGRAVRIGFQEARDAIFKGLFAIGEFRAVLFVFGTDHRVDDGCVVFVKYFIPEYSAAALLLLKWGVSAASDVPMGRQPTRARVRPKRIDFLFM